MNYRKYLRNTIPILLGATGGFLYYSFIGCSENCAITGNPLMSTLYGGMFGVLFTNFNSNKKREVKNEN